MEIFGTTLNQMAFLFSFILLGYILSKLKLIPDNAQATLSKLENYLFIPALVLGTFIDNFTANTLSTAWRLLLSSFILLSVMALLSWVTARICSKDKYEQNIFHYALTFSNFAFMGNAIVSALFPEIFMEYVIFTLPLWTMIYLWGAPVLLIGSSGGGRSALAERLKSFLNPMVICVFMGMIIGLSGIKLPSFVSAAISSSGSCMSPIAMLLTGMTIAKYDLKKIMGIKSMYAVSFFRLIVYPALFLGVGLLAKMSGLITFDRTFYICALCSLAMPSGLNAIVIPSAYGKDTTIASGMALVSHLLGCITIPIIFAVYQMIG